MARKQTKRWIYPNESEIIDYLREHGVVPEEYQHTSEYNSRDLSQKNKALKKQVASQLDRIKSLESVPEIVKTLAHITSHPVAALKHHKSSGESESVAILALSDLHIEEIVKGKTVNNLNEYSPKIAKTRLERVFTRFVRLVEIQRHGTEIKQVVLFLGGDLITGHIHDENKSNNAMSPIEAIQFLIDPIRAGISFIEKSLGPDKLTIVCVSGNHGRTTQKPSSSTREESSLEALLYGFLASYYDSDPVINFVVAGGYHLYVDIWPDYKVRFHHGDAFKSGGGVGGISIPVNKKIDQWNKAIFANLDIFGHFHHRLDGGHWVSNGSLIGWNPFAIKIGAKFEEPAQVMVLIERRKGKTLVAPVFAE